MLMNPRALSVPPRVFPLFALILLAALTLVVASPLFSCGWYMSHEGTDPLQRIIALGEEIRNGDFYPRWLSLTYFGKGSPFFNFYSPLAYLLPAYLHEAGIPLLSAIKGTATLLFFTGAWGMYLWSSRHFSALGGLISAILYLFIPYHFVDIYVRGAFAEFTALALLPYLFLGIDQTLESPKLSFGFVVTACSAAAILLTHNLSALMIMPMAIAYSLLRITSVHHRARSVVLLLSAALLGAGLSSFYWLPMLLEKKYLNDLAPLITAGYDSFEVHFVEPRQWFSAYWGFGPSRGPGEADEMSFQLGVVLSGCMLLAFAPLVSPENRKRVRIVSTLLFCGGLSLVCTTSASSFLYRHLAALSFVQFPWRFLGPATLFFAAGCGIIAMHPLIKRCALPFLLMLITASLVLSSAHRTVPDPYSGDMNKSIHKLIDSQAMGSLCGNDEYLPRGVPADMISLKTDGLPYTPTGKITQLSMTGKTMRFVFNGRKESNQLIVPWFYFPGWKAAIDGHQTPVVSSPDGFLLLFAPQGKHEMSIHFGTTLPRILGWIASSLSFLAILSCCSVLKQKRGKRWEGNTRSPQSVTHRLVLLGEFLG